MAAVQIYDLSHIHLPPPPSRNSQSDQKVDGLIAQLVEHCNGIAEVIGLNPFRG